MSWLSDAIAYMAAFFAKKPEAPAQDPVSEAVRAASEPLLEFDPKLLASIYDHGQVGRHYSGSTKEAALVVAGVHDRAEDIITMSPKAGYFPIIVGDKMTRLAELAEDVASVVKSKMYFEPVDERPARNRMAARTYTYEEIERRRARSRAGCKANVRRMQMERIRRRARR